MSITTMSSKGQIVIPAEVRRQLGIGEKSRFRVEVRDGVIQLTPLRDDRWKSLAGSLRDGPSLTKQLEEDHRWEIEREEREIERLKRQASKP